jgi:phospholipase/carboxylesterase
MRALAVLLFAGCATMSTARFDGHLQARPYPEGIPPPRMAPGPGRPPHHLTEGRDGIRYVPAGWTRRTKASPLLVLLHGAGGSAARILTHFEPIADELGLLVLAPDSRGRTWDGPLGDLGPDVAFLDRALGFVFERFPLDLKHIALSGFSDGASEALTLGLTNGVLFTHVIAFSPGSASPPGRAGWPRVFVAHGTADEVLPIDETGRPIAARLRAAGYDLSYREFQAGHVVPEELMREALRWFLEK